jgi:FlaG/FlaF family flagellin (archaellin)
MIFMTQHTTCNDAAISPVIGVMLLLTVTVMIVAIVSSYASGLSETNDKAPQLIISPEIYREYTGGTLGKLYMNIPVLSAGNGIQTRDLKIITEWRSFGDSGGGSVEGRDRSNKYPTGHGAGVRSDDPKAEEFGSYTLLGGTLMYVKDGPGCEALFGSAWPCKNLDEGDLVTLRIVHTPSQAVIVNQDIVVRRV